MSRAGILVVAAFLLLGPATASWAEVYRWLDAGGAVNYSDGIDRVPAEYRARAVPIDLRNAPGAPAVTSGAAQAGGSGAVGKTTGTGGTEVKFTPGQAIVVEAVLNGNTATRLILDTGADVSVVNPRVLVAAGVSLTQGRSAQMRGATGSASVQTVQIDSVAVGAAQVSKLHVISHDIEQEGVDGLLGRNFLDQFKVAIDSQAGLVTLSPK